MLFFLAIFMPAYVSILFLYLLIRRARKTPAQKLLTAMVFIMLVFTFSDALYFQTVYSSSYLKLFADISCSSVVPLLPVFTMLMLCHMLKIKYPNWIVGLLLFFPLINICVSSTLYLVPGLDQSAAFCLAMEEAGMDGLSVGFGGKDCLPEGFQDNLFLWQARFIGVIYYMLIGIEMIGVLIFNIYHLTRRKERPLQAFNFFFRGKESSPFYIMVVSITWAACVLLSRILLGSPYMASHPVVAVFYCLTLSLLIYIINYTGLIAHVPSYTLLGAMRPLLFEQNQGENMVDNQEENTDEPGKKKLVDISEVPHVYRNLMNSLSQLMDDENLFLNPDLTIEDVASELCSNRVYVSKAVNLCLGLTFREYINKLRVDYAKQYMLEHPDQTQDAVAAASGFIDASAFNRKFRQIQGATPREWLDMGGD